jgi:protein gp37
MSGRAFSVENAKAAGRIAYVAAVPAAARFFSCEPLLGPLNDLPLDGIHWVIVGGEPGPHARSKHAEWVESILQQCRDAGWRSFSSSGRHKKTPERLAAAWTHL